MPLVTLIALPFLGSILAALLPANARTTEYAYLASPAFAELLQRLGVQLATGPQAVPPQICS